MNFPAAVGAISAAAGAFPSPAAASPRPVHGRTPAVPADGLLAGMSLHEIRERFRHDLFDRWLPFFLRHMVDRVKGGFFPYTELDGTPRPPEGRTPWWLGRGIWTTACLASRLNRQECLDAAQKAADILLRNLPSGENRWPSAFDREGNPVAGPAQDIYQDMFAAEGFAALAGATGREEYRDLARTTVFRCLRLYDRPDYTYTVSYGPAGVSPLPGARILPHWMVFLNTSSQMLRDDPDPDLDALVRRCTDAVIEGHLHPEYRLLNEVRARDFSIPEGPLSRFSYTGHAYETLWMVMSEAERRKDGALFTRAAELFERHVQASWDDVYGGVFASCLDVDANIWGTAKSAWSQVEVMVGCLLVLEHRGTPWAGEMFGKMYRYFQDRYSLESQGCPVWSLGGDRNLKTVRPGTGDIYHIPRWLMLCLLSLDRIIARNGMTSGL